jgi:hypothetical protein
VPKGLVVGLHLSHRKRKKKGSKKKKEKYGGQQQRQSYTCTALKKNTNTKGIYIR